jgi:2',3'-cyclic-nucleotide 2'-phosphodiesterase (5'-nucleotidase family)
MRKFIFIICVGASLLACSSHIVIEPSRVPITPQNESNQKTDVLIQPYRDSMTSIMSEVIAKADTNFVAQRPSSNLINWVADAVFIQQTQNVRLTTPTICLLNTGGIRSSLGKGELTLGDFYKVMPFDNTIVWIELPIEALDDIAAYVTKTGGEPISNCTVEKGKLKLNSMREGAKTCIVITSDYLANAGDKMDFLKKGKVINQTGKLMRDVLIEHAKQEGVLISNTEVRFIP